MADMRFRKQMVRYDVEAKAKGYSWDKPRVEMGDKESVFWQHYIMRRSCISASRIGSSSCGRPRIWPWLCACSPGHCSRSRWPWSPWRRSSRPIGSIGPWNTGSSGTPSGRTGAGAIPARWRWTCKRWKESRRGSGLSGEGGHAAALAAGAWSGPVRAVGAGSSQSTVVSPAGLETGGS